jgi:hypothetical protein
LGQSPRRENRAVAAFMTDRPDSAVA